MVIFWHLYDVLILSEKIKSGKHLEEDQKITIDSPVGQIDALGSNGDVCCLVTYTWSSVWMDYK